MNVLNSNIVTAPGDSDPQVPAVVGVPEVTAESNVASPIRSSSNGRDGAGVASQAPVTLTTTSAETVVCKNGTQQPSFTLAEKIAASNKGPKEARLPNLTTRSPKEQ